MMKRNVVLHIVEKIFIPFTFVLCVMSISILIDNPEEWCMCLVYIIKFQPVSYSLY